MSNTNVATDPPFAREMREALVRELVADGDVRTPAVAGALRNIPRHAFMPHAPLAVAYANRAVPIGDGQTISQPALVAVMTEALELTGRERVLEIGTGSGYQAAVLALLAREVFTIERIDALAIEAAARLVRLGFDKVHVRAADGFDGWPEEAPFDRVLVTAAPPELPRELVAQLAEGGILVAPVGEQDAFEQTLVRVRKRNGRLALEDLGGVAFVEMVRGRE